MKEPTKEQIKEFWEWCGLKWFWNHSPECKCGAVDDDDSCRSWHYYDGEEWQLATMFYYEPMDIDLNNLFKYAVPKLQDKINLSFCFYLPHPTIKVTCKIKHWEKVEYLGIGDDPALALFQAIYEVIKEDK